MKPISTLLVLAGMGLASAALAAGTPASEAAHQALAEKANLPHLRPVLPSLLTDRDALDPSGTDRQDAFGAARREVEKAANPAAAEAHAAAAARAEARAAARAAAAAAADEHAAAEKVRTDQVKKDKKDKKDKPHPEH